MIRVLGGDDERDTLRDAVATFARDRAPDEALKAGTGRLDRSLWRELGALGVLGAGADGESGAREVVAVCEALGARAFPGPVVESFVAGQLLGDAERAAVAAGQAIVSVGVPPLLPFAADADVFVVLDASGAWRGRPLGPVAPLATLGGDPWGRVDLERGEALPGAERARSFGRLASAALLAAAARRLLADAADHARARRQFGRAIGEFQAVAHPLADRLVHVAAAEMLARLAASRLDAGDPDAPRLAAAARLSAREAALGAAHQAHQCFGAVGITLEGPVFHVSRRIRQWASLPLGDDAARGAVAGAVLTAGGPS